MKGEEGNVAILLEAGSHMISCRVDDLTILVCHTGNADGTTAVISNALHNRIGCNFLVQLQRSWSETTPAVVVGASSIASGELTGTLMQLHFLCASPSPSLRARDALSLVLNIDLQTD